MKFCEILNKKNNQKIYSPKGWDTNHINAVFCLHQILSVSLKENTNECQAKTTGLQKSNTNY